MSALLSLGETAARVNLSADRLRKSWRRMHYALAFPAPALRPPEARYGWDPALVEAWVRSRSSLHVGRAGSMRPAANDEHPLTRAGAIPPERLESQRRQLAAFMKGS
jgi:hypothetical protein